MQSPPQRLVAIDWSGALSAAEQRRRIVIADWQAGSLSLTAGRTRAETTAWLIEQAQQTPQMVAGLDFSFSLPAWFVEQSGASTVEAFWEWAALNAEQWLGRCDAPFWGRPAKRCPADHRGPVWRGYRQCEQPGKLPGRPSSTFQIGGAGAVGTGSLRGMQTLRALRAAGFSIWPFHAPAWPAVLEIYPRCFTGPVVKSSEAARWAYLERYLPAGLPREVLRLAGASEDAFDALCSVIGMERQREAFATLEQAADAATLIEGTIFPGRSLQPVA